MRKILRRVGQILDSEWTPFIGLYRSHRMDREGKLSDVKGHLLVLYHSLYITVPATLALGYYLEQPKF